GSRCRRRRRPAELSWPRRPAIELLTGPLLPQKGVSPNDVTPWSGWSRRIFLSLYAELAKSTWACRFSLASAPNLYILVALAAWSGQRRRDGAEETTMSEWTKAELATRDLDVTRAGGLVLV